MPHVEITPYRERTLTRRPALPPRVRELQDLTIHRELIEARKRQAREAWQRFTDEVRRPRLESPLARYRRKVDLWPDDDLSF